MEDTLVLFFAFTMLYMSASSRLKSSINMLGLQGLLLFLIFNKISNHVEIYNYIFLAFETLVIKMLVIPMIIWRVAKKNETFTDTEPNIPRFYSLVIATLILFFGFIFAAISRHHMLVTNPIPFGISIATIILGLFFITVRKKILTAIIGYIMMENGIFLLSLSIEKRCPLLLMQESYSTFL